MSQKGQIGVGQTKHGRESSSLWWERLLYPTVPTSHLAGGSTLDSALAGETDAAILTWLVGALEHARARGQTRLVSYLEAVVDDVVFEVKAAARGRGYRHGRYI